MTPPDTLEAAAALYRERNKLYGDNYKRFGPIMALLFPDGLTLKTAEDFGRFGILVQVIAKQTRYAENFTRGGHEDSLDDTIVYAAMLKELDEKPARFKASDIQWIKSGEPSPRKIGD